MTLDVRGSLKNTKINKNYYVFIDEMLSNAIDSYLIRKDYDATNNGMSVVFDIEFLPKDLFDEGYIDLKISCTDNGAGLGDSQTKAFVTKDTSFKDDLSIGGIGKCKGSGRIQFFHYFNKLSIQSVYKDGDSFKARELRVDDSIKEIEESSFSVVNTTKTETTTKVTLDIVKPDVYAKVFLGKNLKDKFSVSTLKNYVLVAFLQRLIGLKESLGDFCITFKTVDGEQEETLSLIPSELPKRTEERQVKVYYHDDSGLPVSDFEEFSISHYKLNKDDYTLKRNTVALCAKSSIAKLITNRFLKTQKLENNPVNDCYHIILVESPFLDSNVNEQRDDFNIPKDQQSTDTYLSRLLSFEELYDELGEHITEMLAPPDWDKDALVKKVENKYGISAGMVANVNVRVHYGDTEETVVKRVLTKYQSKIIKDTSEIFDIKEEIINADPNSDEFRKKINDLAWKYTASLKNIDMANLSQIVVRRAAILEILQLAIDEQLKIQEIDEGVRRQNEKIIHNIFFPMRSDSQEVTDHDIWIFNEEYQYYDYIASDQPLSKFKWVDDQPLFDDSVDDELSKILKKNYEDNSEKRPDIAIFNTEGAAIIIEFKAQGVEMGAHIGDLMEYAQLLAAKSNGKINKFYGYLVGTELNTNRLMGYTPFANNKGWFGTHEVRDFTTQRQVGELYSEILYYKDIAERANKRLDVYKKRLNLSLGS